jgi:pyruvate dehydrogenase E1 component alpha subunit
MPATKVDGNDVAAVKEAAATAIAGAREGAGPAYLECITYRQVGHSRSDPAKYRPEGELEEWLEKDPIENARRALLAREVEESRLDEVRLEVAQLIEAATAGAGQSPFPSPDTRLTEFADAH